MGLLRSRSRSQQRFKMSVNVCPDDIFSMCLIVSALYLLNCSTTFVIKLGVVMYYHEAMCHAEKLVHYFQCQGHSEGLTKQNMTISTISSTVPFATKLSLIVLHHKPECPVENWITAFRAKATAVIQNVNECLSGWYLLNHRTFCYQIWCCDAAS